MTPAELRLREWQLRDRYRSVWGMGFIAGLLLGVPFTLFILALLT